jgi:hypothetical protein
VLLENETPREVSSTFLTKITIIIWSGTSWNHLKMKHFIDQVLYEQLVQYMYASDCQWCDSVDISGSFTVISLTVHSVCKKDCHTLACLAYALPFIIRIVNQNKQPVRKRSESVMFKMIFEHNKTIWQGCIAKKQVYIEDKAKSSKLKQTIVGSIKLFTSIHIGKIQVFVHCNLWEICKCQAKFLS